MVYVVYDLSATQELRQEQLLFFSESRYRTKAMMLKMCPANDVLCS